MSITTAKDRLSTLVDDLVANLASANVALSPAQVTALYNVAGNWLDASQYKVITLSANKPDFNQLLLQFQNALEHEDAWKDTLTAGAGQAILRFISASVAMSVYAQERSTQERYSYLARLPSSIFADARSKGVRVSRTTPANVPVTLARTGTSYLSIPAFTAFTVGSTKFYNRVPIIFSNDNLFSVNATLTEGEVFVDTYSSPGQPYVTYEVGSGDGLISDIDVYLTVDGQPFTRVLDAFFNNGPNDTVFYENTLPNGNVEVYTGSGNYGVMPASNSVVQITYATTTGIAAQTSSVEIPVLCPDFSTITGFTSAPVTGAITPPSLDYYRINAPYIRSKQNRSVIRRDWEQTALDYKVIPIRDVRVIGQQEIAPNSPGAMGVLQICALTDILMTDVQWTAFQTYMHDSGLEGLTLLRSDPIPVPIEIDLTLGINSTGNLDAAKAAAQATLITGYAPTQGVLGKQFFRNDITTLINKSKNISLNGAVDSIDIASPAQSTMVLAWNQYIVIGQPNVTPIYSDRTYSNRIGFDSTV